MMVLATHMGDPGTAAIHTDTPTHNRNSTTVNISVYTASSKTARFPQNRLLFSSKDTYTPFRTFLTCQSEQAEKLLANSL